MLQETMIVTDPTPHPEPPRYWTKSTTAPRWNEREAPPLHRFIGGSPLGVVFKLALVSLLVGAMLVWLDIRPVEVFRELSDMFDRLWALGFRSVREFGDYIVAGAAIVVPVWFILRLISYRR